MIRVFVFSPVTYKAFQKHFPQNFPAEFLLLNQHAHRYMAFVDFWGWRSKHIYRDDRRRIECDDFDRENTIYSIAVDERNRFLGSVRAYSTLHPYMLELDEFSDTSPPGFSLPKAPNIFEGSRIINPHSKIFSDFKAAQGGYEPRRVGTELLMTHMELGRALGIDAFIATMPPALLHKAYGRMGWDVDLIGAPNQIVDAQGNVLDLGVPTQNYMYAVSEDAEEKIRTTTGIQDQVSDFGVPRDVLPDLLAHMKEAALAHHPHRFEALVERHKQAAQPQHEVPAILERELL